MMMKKLSGLGILDLMIILTLLMAGIHLLQYLRDRSEEQNIATCSLPAKAFRVVLRGGYLRPVDPFTGFVSGRLARRPDGEITLTSADGVPQNITTCLSGKLDGVLLNALPLHG